MTTQPPGPTRSRILGATVIAAAVAVILLFVVILPAEYGIDPLGTGKALGLTALSGTEPAAPPQATTTTAPGPQAAAALANDEYKVELRPFESVEYKYRLEQGAALVYVWASSAPVEFEFHGEPDGAPAKYFDSYSKGTSSKEQGAFTAAKAGIHGWYFKNHSETRVTVTLKTAGFFAESTEFRDGEKIQRKFLAGGNSRRP
jgi:hypothetical protein